MKPKTRTQLRALDPVPDDPSYRYGSWMAYRAKIGHFVAEEKPPCAVAPERLGDEGGFVECPDAGRLARRAVAKSALKVAPGEWKAYALNPDGSCKREIVTQYVDGALHFTADIAGDSEEAEFHYELVR